jgi:hypothetical protein
MGRQKAAWGIVLHGTDDLRWTEGSELNRLLESLEGTQK